MKTPFSSAACLLAAGLVLGCARAGLPVQVEVTLAPGIPPEEREAVAAAVGAFPDLLPGTQVDEPAPCPSTEVTCSDQIRFAVPDEEAGREAVRALGELPGVDRVEVYAP